MTEVFLEQPLALPGSAKNIRLFHCFFKLLQYLKLKLVIKKSRNCCDGLLATQNAKYIFLIFQFIAASVPSWELGNKQVLVVSCQSICFEFAFNSNMITFRGNFYDSSLINVYQCETNNKNIYIS